MVNSQPYNNPNAPDRRKVICWTFEVICPSDWERYIDCRIARSLAIATLNATVTTTIHRAEAATIFYPDFIPTLQQICG